MTQEEYEAWAAALIESEFQRFMHTLNTYQVVEDETIFHKGFWPDDANEVLVDLIDTATCTIEVDWPPRVKGRPLQ